MLERTATNTRFAQTRHARCAYSVRGEGPPILLIHGAEATRNSFEALGALLARSMTVYTYDQRQCGETESDSAPTSVLDLVEDAAQLVGQWGLDKLTVLGTSFGGRVAQGLTIQHPGLVSRLVLCNTWPLDVALETVNWVGLARLQVLRQGLPATARWLAQAYYGREYVGEHPELVARFAQRQAGSSGRTSLVRSIQPLGLERITAPTLLIAGSEDQVVPPRVMHAMHTRIADSALVDIQGAHHAITVERPRDVACEIESFMRRSER